MSRPILAAIPIKTVASHPSLQCLQWSADGQVAFITKTSVIIFTPDHGINFDADSVTRSTPTKDDNALGWFRTAIQSDPSSAFKEPDVETVQWPDHSQTWGTVSMGSIDFSLVGLATSPSELSSTGRCIFVTLSSNMDVNLWTAKNNHLKGKWMQTFALTPFLLSHFTSDVPDSNNTAAVLQAQIVTVAWTPQVDFGLEPKPHIDGSLLVLGSRAGYLTFLRYRNGEPPEIVTTLSVSDYWISSVAFSSWSVVESGTCEGLVAYATSRGSVGLVKITQTLETTEDNLSYGPKYHISVKCERVETPIYGPESRAGVTALQWAHIPGRTPILITCVPGLVKLWSARTIQDVKFWTGHRALRIELQKIYVGCSPFHPVSGLACLPREDKLVLTLADGSFHVVGALSTAPAWCTQSAAVADDDEVGEGKGKGEGGRADPVTSQGLSAVSREVFADAEKRALDWGDMGEITGARSYDDGGCFMWVYEAARPSDFSYKHDAKHISTFVVAQMWDAAGGDAVITRLEDILSSVQAASGLSPLNVLRPILLHLRNPARLDALHVRLLDIIRPQSNVDHSTKINAPEWDGEVNDDFRRQFRTSIATNLFGWDDLLSLRMRLSLADFAWKLSTSEDRQGECGVIAQKLLTLISHRILRTMIRYLLAVLKQLTPKDVPFVSRVIVQSLLPGCPDDLREEGNQLSIAIQPFLTGDGNSTSIVSQLNETCPACGVEVPLQDITSAVCTNGHTWLRCSVTTFILATPSLRTCVGCSRKAFVPHSAANNTLPTVAQGWVVEDLLEAVQHCLFCNNAFVSIV